MAITAPQLLMLSTRKEQPLNADTGQAGTAEQVKQPAFVTVQSLVTFSGASAAVAGVWKIIMGAVSADWADKRIVPAVLCIAVGIFFLLVALESAPKLSDKWGAILVSAFNTAFLWAAVVGIDVTT